MNAHTLDLMLRRELPNAAAGCQQAYGRIVFACQNTVTAIALAITRDLAASEDIAKEAFLRAWQQLAQLHQPASFLPWLRQITRNLARDWLRQPSSCAQRRGGRPCHHNGRQPCALAYRPTVAGGRRDRRARHHFCIARRKPQKRCCCTTAKARARSRLRLCSNSATRQCVNACRAHGPACAANCCAASATSHAAAHPAQLSPAQ